jgi:membrane-bound ClpP family serine protease
MFASMATIALAAAPASAQEPADAEAAPEKSEGRVGRLIRVPVPITGRASQQTEAAIRRVLSALPQSDERPVLVLEFSPGQTEFGAGSEFGAAYELAGFLASPDLSRVKTIAYLPQTIKGHAVLPVLACEEIFMASDAKIGEAGIDEAAISKTQRVAYEEIAGLRKTIPVPVALGMLDRQLKVLRAETLDSVQYIFDTELEDLKNRETIRGEPETLIETNEMGLFDGRTMKAKLGFVSYLADSRQDVIDRLGLPPRAVEDDLSSEGWRPIRVDLKGPVEIQMVSRLERMIDRQLEGDTNLVCVYIDSPGGSLTASLSLASYLANLDSAKVRTVAYVPSEARAEAAIVALACDHLVMHPGAMLGGRSRAGEGADEAVYSADEIASAVTSIKEIARLKNHRWSLRAAMIDGKLVVYPYTDTETGSQQYMSEQEAKELEDAARWQKGEPPVAAGDGPLETDGERSVELGLASDLVEDFDQFKQLYSLEGDPALVEPNWVDLLVRALSDDGVAVFLLFLGGAAVIAELQMPGIGLGGFVACVCFLLFFWAKYLDGTATGLEIILFLTGLVFLAMELFVLPGMGVFGLGGGLLMIASLVLASQTFIMPRSAAQVAELQHSLLMVGVAGAGVVTASIMMRRYLPHTPLLNRIFLTPPEGSEKQALREREGVDFTHLVGRQGKTTTQCTPSGKALFGEQHVNVIAGGELIAKGVLVEVAAVEGNRVIIREISGRSSTTPQK